jgi:hypothetical protein
MQTNMALLDQEPYMIAWPGALNISISITNPEEKS